VLLRVGGLEFRCDLLCSRYAAQLSKWRNANPSIASVKTFLNDKQHKNPKQISIIDNHDSKGYIYLCSSCGGGGLRCDYTGSGFSGGECIQYAGVVQVHDS